MNPGIPPDFDREFVMQQVFFESSESGSPDTPEWHAWRAAGIGGSDASPIAAAHGLVARAPWMPSLHRLWEQKVGLRSGPPVNYAMQRGRDGEGPARADFEKRTGIPVTPIFGEMDDHRVIRASLDGISFDGDVLVEIKCPGQRVHDLAVAGEIVDYYLPQVAHQAMVAWGLPERWKPEHTIMLFSYIPETGAGALVEKKAIELRPLAEAMLPHELAFWSRVASKSPPAGDAFTEAAIRWRILMDEADDIDALVKEAREELVGFLAPGVPRMEGGGVIVSRSAVKGRIDYDALLKAKNISPEEAEQFRGKPSEKESVKRSADATPIPVPKAVTTQDATKLGSTEPGVVDPLVALTDW